MQGPKIHEKSIWQCCQFFSIAKSAKFSAQEGQWPANLHSEIASLTVDQQMNSDLKLLDLTAVKAQKHYMNKAQIST